MRASRSRSWRGGDGLRHSHSIAEGAAAAAVAPCRDAAAELAVAVAPSKPNRALPSFRRFSGGRAGEAACSGEGMPRGAAALCVDAAPSGQSAGRMDDDKFTEFTLQVWRK